MSRWGSGGEVLFEVDPLSGTRTLFSYDHDRDTFTLREEQNVEHILEISKYLASMGRGKGDIRHVGQIPMTVLGQMMTSWRARNLTKEERQAELAAWLNDGDVSKFRTDDRSHI